MKAKGHHILIQKPAAPKETSGGLLLPDKYDVAYSYGRVLSIGDGVPEMAERVRVSEGDVVLFDPNGVTELELHPSHDRDVVVAHATQVFAVITRNELETRNLPIP